MRTDNSHLLDNKMEDVVTHFTNSHHGSETVHVDANGLSLNIHDESSGRIVTLMHPGQNFPSQLYRHIPLSEQQVGDGPWGDELSDPDGKIAALVAHLTQNSRISHHQLTHHKAPSLRGDVDSSVILDGQLRMYNGHAMDQTGEPILVEVPPLPPLPPLQDMKRGEDADWFHKSKSVLKNPPILSDTGTELDLNAGSSPAQNKQNKKSLPHKKRISKKLKRSTGRSTPQQELDMSMHDEVHHEEILPDNFVSDVHHTEQLPETHQMHHEVNEVRSVFICQLCGDYYGEEQFKFYQHLKQHYEPPSIIIENSVPDLGIDKMTNTCIVDNVSTLPDSIVELTLDNTVPKTIYQPIDKHILYSSSDRTLSYTNKVAYSMASMDKDPSMSTLETEKSDLYETLDYYTCTRCNKTFKKQKQCEAHIKEAHPNSKMEVMSEFSDTEDLMEGIHVLVEETVEPYEQTLLLPHLTVENGHVHREPIRPCAWYMRNQGSVVGGLPSCGDDAYCTVCPAPTAPPAPPAPPPPPAPPVPPAPPPAPPLIMRDQHEPQHLKEEVLQRILETDVANTESQVSNFNDNLIIDEGKGHTENKSQDVKKVENPNINGKKKGTKRFECVQCERVFLHRNSLLYHIMRHTGKQHSCRECGKGFYTTGALKIHKRVHNGDRPWKCEDCGKEFRQKSDLKYHQVSLHSNQKQFKCEYCTKAFARKYSLSVHRRIHTGEKNYKCSYCSKSFRTSSYRQSHMRVHTGDRPHQCNECEKSFRVAGDLRRHKLTHDKFRNRIDANKQKDKKSNKDETDTKKSSKKSSTDTTPKEVSIIKNATEKKQKSLKKAIKKLAAPNVTITEIQKVDGHLVKSVEYQNVSEIFDTRQVNGSFNKFKEVFDSDYHKVKDSYQTEHRIVEDYKGGQKIDDKDFATLRPLSRGQTDESVIIEEKPIIRENTDGRLTVYTLVDRSKEYNGSISQGDMRALPRDIVRDTRTDTLHGESNENCFIERLTAIYNISTV